MHKYTHVTALWCEKYIRIKSSLDINMNFPVCFWARALGNYYSYSCAASSCVCSRRRARWCCRVCRPCLVRSCRCRTCSATSFALKKARHWLLLTTSEHIYGHPWIWTLVHIWTSKSKRPSPIQHDPPRKCPIGFWTSEIHSHLYFTSHLYPCELLLVRLDRITANEPI